MSPHSALQFRKSLSDGQKFTLSWHVNTTYYYYEFPDWPSAFNQMQRVLDNSVAIITDYDLYNVQHDECDGNLKIRSY